MPEERMSLMTDERRGLPSISSLERYALCPGSWQAETWVRAFYPKPEVRKSDEWSAADAGNRIHAALAGDDDVELSRYEGWTKERCEEYELTVLAQLKEEYGFEPSEVIREQRFSLGDKRFELGGQIISTGKADVIYVYGDNILVVDYKTGSIGAGNIELNYQLTGYAVLAWQNFHGTQNVFVAIVQPNAPEKISVASLNYDDLKRAEVGIVNVIQKATSGTIERHAELSKQCKYCPAKGFCPEFVAASSKAITLSPDLEVAVSLNAKTAAEDYLMNVAPVEQVVAIFEKRQVLETILDAVKRRLKTELNGNPESVPGYELAPSGAIRSMTDLQAALNKIRDLMTPEEFRKLLTISIPALEKTHKEKSGLKGKAAEEDFDARFSELIVSVPKELQIRKKKV